MKHFIKHYLQLPFLLSIICLLSASGAINYFKVQRGVTLVKKVLPLKAPFDQIDENLLKPYKISNIAKITNRDVLESLGTEDYLQCELEDLTVDILSPIRYCSVFITYYTGNPDQVPHVPEACYTGGGNEVKEKFSVMLDISDINMPGVEKEIKVPATGLIFAQKTSEIWQSPEQFPIIYFFKVNDVYKGNRTATRVVLGNLTSEYSYFSKVELKFFNARKIYPDKQQSIEACEKLLRVLLPVLEKNHWPDWE
ncbi:MAG: hypothetical protein JW806_04570 [Sedimentisphaerales bacterium]|nr:hypothetical protein [Sedimentisphaerales bacterium]